MIETYIADLANERISTSRASLLAAFAHVIGTAGRRRVTDLHVRRLLKYVRAHDRYYTGVPISLTQLARKLALSVPTCRRVIRRAVDEFNLLIVIPQRHNPGGQTINRYTINWDNVDAILHDIENTNSPGTADVPVGPSSCANTDSTPPDNNMPVRLAPSPVRPAPDVPVGSSSCMNSRSSVRPIPNACQSGSDSTREDLAALNREARLLGCHPRLLRLPKRLFDALMRGTLDWPWRVRRAPRETPKELMAHLDIILAKLQTAMDCAQQINAPKIYNRLRTLRFTLAAVQFRASHAAMCRTNLPPINPLPPQNASGATTSAPVTEDQPPSDFESSADSDTGSTAHGATTSDPNARAARTPPASGATTWDPNPRAACTAPATEDQPPSDFGATTTLVVLDELLAALSAAIRSASAYGIAWLHNRFTTARRSVKTIRIATHVLNLQRQPCPVPPQTTLDFRNQGSGFSKQAEPHGQIDARCER
jgi:hypothetical protein